jgi:hypothetical protein
MLYILIVEDKGLDRPWLLNTPKSCDSCTTDKCCNTTICLNDNGHAKSFENVCEANKYLQDKTDLKLAAIGLGNCKNLFSRSEFFFCFFDQFTAA